MILGVGTDLANIERIAGAAVPGAKAVVGEVGYSASIPYRKLNGALLKPTG